LNYSNGGLKAHERDEIQNIFASEAQIWIDSVELLVEELAKGELLPPAIYLVGGGSGLPDLRQKLENFPWTERLPFSRQPIVETIEPTMVTSIVDPNNLLRNAQDITPMALAYQAIELQNEDNVLERVLYRVIHQMHI
jgi:cell division protein FtsA